MNQLIRFSILMFAIDSQGICVDQELAVTLDVFKSIGFDPVLIRESSGYPVYRVADTVNAIFTFDVHDDVPKERATLSQIEIGAS